MKWLYGLAAGSVAALIASLVSLPLNSPDDVGFNTLTVTIASLVAGVVLGGCWAYLEPRRLGRVFYAVAALAVFGIAALVALAAEPFLSGTLSYAIPVAAVAIIIAAVLPVAIDSFDLKALPQLAGTGVLLAAALGLGIGLAGVGDSESGHVDLPNALATAQPGGVIRAADVQGVVYTVVPDESTLKYTVREKLANLPTESDAVGSTGDVTGALRLDGQPSQVQIDMSNLSSDQDFRDSYVRQNIFNTDPIVTVIVDDLGDLPQQYEPGSTYTATLTGTATVRGVERPLTFEIEANLAGGTLQVVGRTDFTWADFDITPPNTSVVQVQDNVHIELLVVAHAGTESET